MDAEEAAVVSAPEAAEPAIGVGVRPCGVGTDWVGAFTVPPGLLPASDPGDVVGVTDTDEGAVGAV